MDQGKGKRSPRDVQGAEQRERKPVGRAWQFRLAKLLIIPFLLFFSLIIGLVIGYSVVGHKPASEVFDIHTYKHMYDLMFSGT
ncbi:DNA-directed RNA polymerase subunit beta [Brevibacillus ruminantium]|uniref:DNA-directed RNA polymerase subunit beta n=1 Tax=Brevibacillus ruminantium TaxID=2950604 RepID=A0ABY4WEV4_9BACL|nr:DNA-directed RNA polymerase subunit beta [Brevibacillus ruminantium]USG65386.1 DNA-directed RNA polymerase subunit beta [Brevibacillus ruminantium]